MAYPAPTSHKWVLQVPFAERSLAQAAGAAWDKNSRVFTYTGTRLPSLLTRYASEPYSWERWKEDDLNRHVQPVPQKRSTLTPRPHQNEAIKTIVKAANAGARGFVIADDVGVGKTISAWVSVLKLSRFRPVKNILVVSPLAVVPHWRRTISDLGAPPNSRICVINYDRAKSLLSVPPSAKTAKRKRTQNKRTAKEGKSLVEWDIIILDEAHKCRHAESQRSAAIARIAKYEESASHAPFVIWMSATIGQNPTELSYLAPLLAQLTGSTSSDLKDFGPWLQEQGFHVTEEPRWKKWSWTDNKTQRTNDIRRMNELMFTRRTPVAIRRVATDIAGWPEIQRILLPVDMDISQRRLYDNLWTEFRKELALSIKGKNPTGGMVATLRFRQKASLIRIDGTVQQALDLLDNGHQVAISFQFLESLDLVHEQLTKKKISVAVMDGRNPSGRENERLKFQRGEATVVLFTPVEGFSLHQNEQLANGSHATNNPRSLIVHDPRYSGIDAIQIEGRTHRDGKAANVYYAYTSGTVEEGVVTTLVDRVLSTKELVGDDTRTLRLLEGILSGNSSLPPPSS